MPAELPIVSVTVHPDGALVERRGSAPITAGTLTIGALPYPFDERSLRVEVDGAELLDVAIGLDLAGIDRTDDPAVDRALRAAYAKVRGLEADRNARQRQRHALESLEPQVGATEDPIPPPERLADWANLAAKLRPTLVAIDERLRELDRDIKLAYEAVHIAETIAANASLEQRLRRWLPTTTVTLRVTGHAEHLTVSLSYRVDAACWVPTYALHADGGLKRGRFQLTALVAQGSGEDWHQAQLVLSTAPSQRIVDVPDLPSLRLGKAQPAPKSPWRELPPGLDLLFPADLPAKPEVSLEIAYAAMYEHEVSDDAAPPPSPKMAAPMPQKMRAIPQAPRGGPSPAEAAPSRAKSAGFFGALADAASSVGGGGGPAAAPAPPPSGAARREAPAQFVASEPLEPDASLLDYGQLRLGGPDDVASRRGRLFAPSTAEQREELALPHDLSNQHRRSLRFDQLPAHHVLPGPLDGVDFAYTATDRVDVPSDGHFHVIAVFSDAIDVDVHYRTVPQLDPRVFRTVLTRLPRPVPMLAGPVYVHIDGALVATSAWRGSPRGGEIRIGLGVEDGLALARNVRYREESAGMLGNYRRTHTDIEVEVASSLHRPARVEVLGRLPVTKDPEVTIELVEATPLAETFRGDEGDAILEGGRRQFLDLAPGAKQTAKLHYTVTVGAKLELEGGDRRG